MEEEISALDKAYVVCHHFEIHFRMVDRAGEIVVVYFHQL